MTAIDEHMSNIIATTSYFEGRLKEIDRKLQILLQRVRILGDDSDDIHGNVYKERNQFQDEKESAKQCLQICAEASRNVNRRLYEQPRVKASGEDKDAVELEKYQEDKSSKQECIQMQSRQVMGKDDTNVFEDVQRSCQIITVASASVFSAVWVTTEAGERN